MAFLNQTTLDPGAGPGLTPATDMEKFVAFELGGELCCVAAAGVAEVAQPFGAAPLPNSPRWLLGIGAFRGEPVAVIDPTIIADPSSEGRGKAKVLIFHARPGETRFALPVDSLNEMIAAHAGDLFESIAAGLPPEIEHKGQPVRFIDHERLFDGLHGGAD